MCNQVRDQTCATMANNTSVDTALMNECARWLTRWNVLPIEFSASQFDSKQFFRIIQDGFVLCQVICKIDPLAINQDEICPRTFDASQVKHKIHTNRSFHIFSVLRVKCIEVLQSAEHKFISKRMPQ